MDHKPEESAREHGCDTGADKRKVRHVQPPEDQADDQDQNIVDAEECLDRCQVFLFVFGGRKQVQRRSWPAGRKETVADAADHSQDRS